MKTKKISIRHISAAQKKFLLKTFWYKVVITYKLRHIGMASMQSVIASTRSSHTALTGIVILFKLIHHYPLPNKYS